MVSCAPRFTTHHSLTHHAPTHLLTYSPLTSAKGNALINEDEILSRVKMLSLALTDDQVSVRWNAAKDLAKLGPAAFEALPALDAALASEDSTTALWARHAIAKICCRLD